MSLRFYSSNDLCLQKTEAVFRRCFVEKLLLKISQNSGKNTCERVYFLIKLQAKRRLHYKNTTSVFLFSCEFCEIFKSFFFMEHLWWLFLPFYGYPSSCFWFFKCAYLFIVKVDNITKIGNDLTISSCNLLPYTIQFPWRYKNPFSQTIII